jgi:hypothetical protein
MNDIVVEPTGGELTLPLLALNAEMLSTRPEHAASTSTAVLTVVDALTSLHEGAARPLPDSVAVWPPPSVSVVDLLPTVVGLKRTLIGHWSPAASVAGQCSVMSKCDSSLSVAVVSRTPGPSLRTVNVLEAWPPGATSPKLCEPGVMPVAALAPAAGSSANATSAMAPKRPYHVRVRCPWPASMPCRP